MNRYRYKPECHILCVVETARLCMFVELNYDFNGVA